MKISFKTLALVFAAVFPAAVGAEALGLTLPSVLSTDTLLGAFVVALTLLTMSTDYRRLKPLPMSAAVARKSVLRLAA